jgi:hypothetical protein
VSLGEQPELRIARTSEIQKTRLRAIREDIRQSRDELVGDVVIEKQFHA